MNIEFPTGFNSVPLKKVQESTAIKPEFTPSSTNTDDSTKSDAQVEINQAGALLQLISMKLSSAVIRQISPGDYMQLMALIDNIVNRTIDREV